MPATTTATSVRWGVLSTSNIGLKVVAPAIARADGAELVGIASRTAGRAAEAAARLGLQRSYASYEDLLADPDIDAVYIPLPNSLHKEWTVKALAAGKHVLCEKPLAASAAECIEMHSASLAANRFVMEAFMYRHHPRMLAARELIASGRLGQVRVVRSAFGFTVSDPLNIRFRPDLAGGALMDVGCYCVDVARFLLDAEPITANAQAVWSDSDIDLHLSGQLNFGTANLVFDCSLDTVRQEFVEVVGTEGTMRIDAAFLPGTGDVEIQLNTRAGGAETLRFAGIDEYRLMAEHFSRAVLNGKDPGQSALNAAGGLAAIEALHRSASSGGQVSAVEVYY